MTPEQLTPFLSTDETRHVIMAPFPHGKHTYATDGRIMIRCPRIEGIEEVKGAPDPTKVWKPFDAKADFKPLPPLSDPVDETSAECFPCDGTGEVVCPHCKWGHECENCDGTGQSQKKDDRWMTVDGGTFAIRYLIRIAALPGARFATAAGVPDSIGIFTCDDGGEGILMGIKVIGESLNEWKPEAVAV